MFMDRDRKELADRLASAREQTKTVLAESTASFMELAMTRMALSMVPGGEKSGEVLETLLKSAIEHGFKAGQGNMLAEVLKIVLTDKRNG